MKKIIAYLIILMSFSAFAQAQTALSHYTNLYGLALNERGQKAYHTNEPAFQQVFADAKTKDSCIVTFPDYYSTDSVTVKIAYRDVVSINQLAFRLRQASSKSSKKSMSIPNDIAQNAREIYAYQSQTQTGMNNATQECTPFAIDGFLAYEAEDCWFKFVAIGTTATVRVTPSYGYDPVLIGQDVSSCTEQYLAASDDGFANTGTAATGGNGQAEDITFPTTPGVLYRVRAYNYDNSLLPNNSHPMTTFTFDIVVEMEATTSGCTLTATAEELAPASIGQSNGRAKAYPADGTSPYTYEWDNGETTRTASSLSAGTHTVIVTDGIPCTATAEVEVTEQGCALSVSINGQTTVCAGGTLALTANINGSSSSTIWSNGETSNTIMVTPIGSTDYIVTVSDGGCTATAVQSVTVNPLPTITLADTITSCPPNADIVATTTDSNANYNWSNGASGVLLNTINVNTANQYSVTVTNGNGCMSSASTVVIEGAKMSVSANATDNGGGSQTVTITPSSAPLNPIVSTITDLTTGQTMDIPGTTFTHIFPLGIFSIEGVVNGECNDDYFSIIVNYINRLSANFKTFYSVNGGHFKIVDIQNTPEGDLLVLAETTDANFMNPTAILLRINRSNGQVLTKRAYLNATPIRIKSVGNGVYLLALRQQNNQNVLVRVTQDGNKIIAKTYNGLNLDNMVYNPMTGETIAWSSNWTTYSVSKFTAANTMKIGYPKQFSSNTGEFRIYNIVPVSGNRFVMIARDANTAQILLCDNDFNVIWTKKIYTNNLELTQGSVNQNVLYVGGRDDAGLALYKMDLTTGNILANKSIPNLGNTILSISPTNTGQLAILTDGAGFFINGNLDEPNNAVYFTQAQMAASSVGCFIPDGNRFVLASTINQNGFQEAYISSYSSSSPDDCIAEPIAVNTAPATYFTDNTVDVNWDNNVPRPTYNFNYSGSQPFTLNTTIVCAQITAVENTTAIEDNAFTLFPNPSTGNEFAIKGADDIFSVAITDVLGRTMLSQKGNFSTNTTVNTERLSTGTYFVTVNNNKPQKLVIIR
jgi:Secretion system C-terminal sorting domain